jgi:hypothetical protein
MKRPTPYSQLAGALRSAIVAVSPWAFALLTVFTAPPTESLAWAAPQEQRHRVVVRVEGTRSDELTKELAGILGDNVDVVPSGQANAAIAKAGQRVPLGPTLAVAAKRTGALKKLRAALSETQAEVGIVGVVRPRKGGNELLLLVLLPGEEEPAIEETLALEKGSNEAALRTALGPLLDGWAAKAAPEPAAPVPAPSDEGAAESPSFERPVHRYGVELVNASVSFDLGGRFFTYSDPVSANLRDYNVFGSPGIALRAEVYPGAPTGIVVLRDLGLTGEFRTALGLGSSTRDGTEVSTQWLRAGGGLRYRVPFGPSEAPYVVAARGGFALDSFTLEGTGALTDQVPSVSYAFVRGGIDARVPLGPVALTAFFDYLGAVSAGDVYDRFREPALGGIDVGGGLVVPIAHGFEARLSAEYVRWFYAFGPVPGDAFVAGGALDENVHLEVGPQYVY